MRFYADENFPLAVVAELRDLEHNVLTAFEDARANRKITDEKVLQRAAELGRAVLTINRRDFSNIHKIDSNHAGIFICTFDADFSRQAKIIDEVCQSIATANGQLIKIYRPS